MNEEWYAELRMEDGVAQFVIDIRMKFITPELLSLISCARSIILAI